MSSTVIHRLASLFFALARLRPKESGGRRGRLLLAALLFAAPRASSAQGVLTGLDVLEQQKFAPLRGKRVGLITNETGVDRRGRRNVELLRKARGVKLVALFSPEHGPAGRADEKVSSSTDPVTGLPVFSLYGETLRPTDEMLKEMDALVFDVQDAGVRFYTYITTMAYAMEEAAKRHIPFYVLDRPNLLGGEILEGPVLERDRVSFTGYFPMPVRYAMTMGELAKMFNEEKKIGCELHVIPMRGWLRGQLYAETGLRWIPPSPNLRTLDATVLYPGLEILQNAGISVGRGTDRPFEQLGAPWMRADELAAALNGREIPGVWFQPARFMPVSGAHKGEVCEGVSIEITHRKEIRSMRLGMEMAAALQKLYPGRFDAGKLLLLLGDSQTVERLDRGDPPEEIERAWQASLAAFRKIRAKYLLYR